ncbi:MAG: hypothetical protein RLW62_02485 [Gammaproteobacteria bacterium]
MIVPLFVVVTLVAGVARPVSTAVFTMTRMDAFVGSIRSQYSDPGDVRDRTTGRRR